MKLLHLHQKIYCSLWRF